MVEANPPKSIILPDPEPLEKFKRNRIKYDMKADYDRADMDDLRKD